MYCIEFIGNLKSENIVVLSYGEIILRDNLLLRWSQKILLMECIIA